MSTVFTLSKRKKLATPDEKTKKLIRDVTIVLVVALIVSIGIFYFRKTFRLQVERVEISAIALSFTTLLFVLLLGFTVSNFWGRYISIGEFINEETSSLLLMVRVLKGYENTNKIIDAIKEYCQHTIDYEWSRFEKGLDSSEENEIKFKKIVNEVNEYSKATSSSPETYLPANVLYGLIPKRDKLKISEMIRNGGYVVNINTLCAAITIFGFLFVNFTVSNPVGQIALDFGFISITGICLFMLYEFQKPFVSSFSHGYQDFEDVLKEIDSLL